MTIQNYLMVNQNTNIVENSINWDGNQDTWQPPVGYLLLVQSTTPAMIWAFDADKNDVVLTQVIGAGGIGFTWNGLVLTTNQPNSRQ